jgi:Fe-S cluster assembly protein SufD
MGLEVSSHLHPVGSFDLSDHPVPTGREEVWRFTPLKRLRGLHDDAVLGGTGVGAEYDGPDAVVVEPLAEGSARAASHRPTGSPRGCGTRRDSGSP